MQVLRPISMDDDDTPPKIAHPVVTEVVKPEPKPEVTHSEVFAEPNVANGPIFVNLGVNPEFIYQVNQDAGILTPTFELPKNGENFMDELVIQEKAKELVRFVNKASEDYKFDRHEVIWLGHSNGANMISAVMLFYPTVIQKAVLLRPTGIVTPKPLPVFADVHVLISSGRQDESVPMEETEKLIRCFQHCGAIVQLHQHDAEHTVTEVDMLAVQKWMLRLH
jgi:predicted esterase